MDMFPNILIVLSLHSVVILTQHFCCSGVCIFVHYE